MKMEKEKSYRLTLWLSVIIVVILVVFALAKIGNAPSPMPTNDTENVLPTISTTTDWIRGNANATTTLTEYADFQCPACDAFYPYVKSLEKELSTKVRFVYRYFPLDQHANARIAAQAAEASGIQNKFWEMHDMLYEHQNDWAELSNTDATNVFIGYAKTLNLDVNKFTTDMNTQAVKDKIEKQFQSGLQFGVDSTPTFFLNNTRLSPQSYAEFQDLVRTAANKNP
jgi:protein-disulfide isomerase